MEFNIDNIRADFPILSRTIHNQPLVYLDSGATAQKPQVVIDTINELHSSLNGNIHRGIHYMAEQTTSRYEAVRELIAEYIGASSSREIVFTSGATASINLVACSFGMSEVKQGDNVVVSEMEHHSNIVPWQLVCQRMGAELRVLPFDDQGRLMIERLDSLVDQRTRIVAITQCSNVLGTVVDISQVVDIAHAKGAKVLVDGCQGIVHSTVNVRELDIDFYAFSGHKLYGPTGTGVLYGKHELLERMPPFLGGGDMISTVSFKTGTTYAELPLKFEAGTSNYIGIIGLGAAIEYFKSFDIKHISTHENHLTSYITGRLLSDIQGLRIYGTMPNKGPIVSFNVDGVHPMDLGMIVDKMGVAIRTGTHCAEPIMEHYGVRAMARISFGMYNTVGECDTAVEAINRAVKMLR